MTQLELRKHYDKLKLTTTAGTYELSFSSSEWGKGVWTFGYASSKSGDTLFGALEDFTFNQFSTLVATDLSTASQISLGNNFSGTEPIGLLRRFDIYSSYIDASTTPSLD